MFKEKVSLFSQCYLQIWSTLLNSLDTWQRHHPPTNLHDRGHLNWGVPQTKSTPTDRNCSTLRMTTKKKPIDNSTSRKVCDIHLFNDVVIVPQKLSPDAVQHERLNAASISIKSREYSMTRRRRWDNQWVGKDKTWLIMLRKRVRMNGFVFALLFSCKTCNYPDLSIINVVESVGGCSSLLAFSCILSAFVMLMMIEAVHLLERRK